MDALRSGAGLRDEARLPPDFHFGVATAGFQIEGGFNGPGEPANNWWSWEHAGQVEPSGIALDFWNRYEEQLEIAAGLGCDSFRLSVEWARVEPEPGRIDHGALARYGRILDAARAQGLMPLVTLHHFTHPEWLGVDFWLRPDSPRRFAAWAGLATEALASRCRHWVTLNEINVLALESFVTGTFPPGRRGDLASWAVSLDHLLTAHVLGYDVIHALQPEAVVSTNNSALSIYELDRLALDLLESRAAGVELGALTAWLSERRHSHHDRMGEAPGPSGRLVELALRRVAARRLPLDRALPRARAAMAASTADRFVDVAQVDFYDPMVARHLRLPGRASAGTRNWLPTRPLWDDPPEPDRLVTACESSEVPGRSVWVVENGLCNRVARGRSHPRADGWNRPRYLRANLRAVTEALGRGIPVTGYWHWTLADNYEWGSYEPRFGLYGVDRERGGRWLETDAMGSDAAGTYRSLIAGLRRGDAAVLGPEPSGQPA